MAKLEVRKFNCCELRASKGFALEGYAARFNSPSRDLGGFTEVILPGAFTRVLATNPDVVCNLQHDDSKILGRTTSGTLKLSQDSTGLKFRCALDPKNSDHTNAYAAVLRKDLTGTSFAFNCRGDDEEWAPDSKGNIIRTIRNFASLCDVAVVTHPAYSGSDNGVAARSAVAAVIRLNEDAVLAATAKRTGVPVTDLQDGELRLRVKTLGEQIVKQNQVEDAALRTRAASFALEAASQPGSDLDARPGACPASRTTTHSKAEHSRAVAFHRNKAQRAKDMSTCAEEHTLADQHERASQGDEGAMVRAYASCSKRDYTKAMFNATLSS